MRVLFLHSNFPGQFLNLAPALGRNPENKVVFITARQDVSLSGVNKVMFQVKGEVHPSTHRYVRPLSNGVLTGQAVYRAAAQLKAQGFIPDVIVGHSGWGNTLFMKDLFPQTPLLCYFEWFVQAHGSVSDFDPDEPLTADDECRLRIQNAPMLIDLYSCDRGISPTQFQHRQFPQEFQDKITVLHDGVNTDFFCPQPGRKVVLPQLGIDLSDVDELVTYVARGMEPCRGFPQFMEAVAILQKRRPNLHVMILGQDRVAYGPPRKDGKTYKQLMLETLPLDLSRIHFTGLLPYNQYVQVLQASSAHLYLTRPFVLSWSMLEAMSAGCLLVASDTEPVREYIEDGRNGLLVDFFSRQQIADRLEEAIVNQAGTAELRVRARETILERCALRDNLPKQINILRELAGITR